MTTATDNTAQASRPDEDEAVRKVLNDFDGLISQASSCSLALQVLLSHTLIRNGYRMTEDERESVLHLASETHVALADISREFNEAYGRAAGRSA